MNLLLIRDTQFLALTFALAPGTKNHGLQIIYRSLNDTKGQLPLGLFKVLLASEQWRKLMDAWRDQAQKNNGEIEAFRRIVKNCI